MGSESSSSSSSSQTTQNVNIDKRLVVGDAGVGLSTGNGNVTLNVGDKGAIQGAFDVVKNNDALNKQTLDGIVGLAEKLFVKASNNLQTQQDTTLKQIEAINTQANNVKGQIDQKTLIILAVAGVAAMALKGSK